MKGKTCPVGRGFPSMGRPPFSAENFRSRTAVVLIRLFARAMRKVLLMNWRNDSTTGEDEVRFSAGNTHVAGTAHRAWSPCKTAAALRVAVVTLSVVTVSGCKGKAPAGALPALPVQVVKAVQRDVPVYGDWVATLDGYVNAQIQPQVTGYLVKQLYREGSYVEKARFSFKSTRRLSRPLWTRRNWHRPKPISHLPRSTSVATLRWSSNAPSRRRSSIPKPRTSGNPKPRFKPRKSWWNWRRSI